MTFYFFFFDLKTTRKKIGIAKWRSNSEIKELERVREREREGEIHNGRTGQSEGEKKAEERKI